METFKEVGLSFKDYFHLTTRLKLLKYIQYVFMWCCSSPGELGCVTMNCCDTTHNTCPYSHHPSQAFLLRLLKDLIDKQMWADEGSVSERMLRSQLLLLACVRKYQPCVQKAEGYFREWKASNGNLRSVLTEQAV